MRKSHAQASRPASALATPFAVIADEVSLSTLRPSTGLLSRAWQWVQARQAARSNNRRLRVAETVSLGEKRFVAVVQVDGRHFLLAGGPTNIALLAQLDDKEPFEEVLKKTMTPSPKRPAKRKQPTKRSAGQGALRVPAATSPAMAHDNRTEALGDVLQKTTTAAGMQRAKQASKQNVRSTNELTEHYA